MLIFSPSLSQSLSTTIKLPYRNVVGNVGAEAGGGGRLLRSSRNNVTVR